MENLADENDKELELDTDTVEEADVDTDTGDEVNPETDIDTEAPTEDGEEEIILQVDGESPAPEEDSSVIRTLRQSHKDTAAENKKLKKQIEALSGNKESELGPKPRIEDFEFETAEYETALSDWLIKKQAVEGDKKRAEEKQAEMELAWNKKVQLHEVRKRELPFANVEETEAVVKQLFSETQIGMIKDGATNSALLIHALGANPAIAEKFSKINNPVQFAFTVGKWEEKVKATKRKALTKPETKIVGQAPVSDDKVLERLRAEAAKSGDMSKVTAYRQAQRKK